MRTDYTKMPIGTKIARGEIMICSLCGRLGLRKQIDDVEFVTHSEWAVLGSNGEIEAGEDECIIRPNSPEAVHG